MLHIIEDGEGSLEIISSGTHRRVIKLSWTNYYMCYQRNGNMCLPWIIFGMTFSETEAMEWLAQDPQLLIGIPTNVYAC